MTFPPRSAERAAFRGLVLFAACSVVFATGSALAYVWAVVSLQDLVVVLGAAVVALIVGLGLMALAGPQRLGIVTGLAALASALPLLSTWVVLSGLAGPGLKQLAGLAALLSLIAALACRHLARARRAALPTAPLLAALCTAAVALPVLWLPAAQEQHATMMGHDAIRADTLAVPPPPLKLATQPDIVLLGFLSAIPDSVAKANLGLDRTGMEDVLDRHGLTRIANAFSGAGPTRRSYDALLNLGTVTAPPEDEDDSRKHPLAGTAESAVFDILRGNGYRIETVTEDKKFGRAAGQYVDRMTIALAPSICLDTLLPDAMRDLVFLGACTLRDSRLYAAISPDDADLAAIYGTALDTALAGPAPTVVLGHFRPPLHYRGDRLAAPDPAATKGFAKRYAEATATASTTMESLLSRVEAANPDAVIFVFGDMGVGLSEPPVDAKATPFAVVDSFGVLAAVKYPGTCPALDRLKTTREAVTTPTILADILGCLAGGAAPPHQTGIALPQGRFDPRAFTYE